MRVKIVYLEWVREKIGKGEELIEINEEDVRVGEMIERIKERGEEYDEDLENEKVIREEINKEKEENEEMVKDGEEVEMLNKMKGG